MKQLATIFLLLLALACDAQNTTKRAKGRVSTVTVQPAPVPVLVINDTTVTEGGNIVFTVTKVGVTSLTVSASYSTAAGTAGSGDYTPVSGSVNFGPTEYVKQITIATTDDSEDEVEQETMYVNLTSPVSATIGKGQGVGVIIDNDETLPPPDLPTITINDRTVNEAAGTASFTVTRTGDLSGASQVSYTTANNTAQAGSDFTTATGTIPFAAGEDVKTITVTILNDTEDENSETFLVNLSSPVNCTITDGQGVGTITDDDDTPPPPPPSFSISDVSISEGGGAAVFTITKTGATNLSSSVIATTSAGTAGEQDYTAKTQTITFLSTEYTKTFSVAVLEDAIDETTELFYANLSGAVNATISDAQGTGTIIDNDTTIVPPPPPPAPTCTYVIEAATYGLTLNGNNAVPLNQMFRYIETLPRDACKTIIMPEGQRIPVSTLVTICKTDNLIWQGLNSTIISTMPVLSSDYLLPAWDTYSKYILMRADGVTLFSGRPVRAAIDSNSTALTLFQTDAVKIKAGDLLLLQTTKSDRYNTGNKQGAYKVVQSVNTVTGVVTVTTPFLHEGTMQTSEVTGVTAFRPNAGWKMLNQRWELFPGSLGTCIYLEEMRDLLVKHCFADGKAVIRGEEKGFTIRTKDSYIGIGAYGSGITFDSCEGQNFWCGGRTLGYVFSAGGENITFKNSIVRTAKHGITVSDRRIYNYNILIDSCTTDDAMIEVHEDTKYAVFQNTTLRNIGATTYGTGAYLRGYYQTIRKCLFEAAPSFWGGQSTTAIVTTSGPGSINSKVDTNIINGAFTYAIQATAARSWNMKMRGNAINGAITGVLLRWFIGSEFSGNDITARGRGIAVNGHAGSLFSNNHVRFGTAVAGNGLYMETNTTEAWTGSTFTGNTFEAGAYSSTPVRIQNGYNLFSFINNTITWPGSRFTTSNSIQINECLTCTQIAIHSNTGSNLNINTLP